MRFRNSFKFLTFLFFIILLASCGPNWSEEERDGYHLILQENGPDLGYSPESGVSILTVDGLAFKDLNQNSMLDPYEDWRMTMEERAKDLASRMSVDEIAGLMLYSGHQSIPGGGYGPGGGTYDGKPFDESDAPAYNLTDQQIDFITNDHLRHILITSVESPEAAARWSNNVQALAEGSGHGIPANNSSDPRHEANADEEYTLGAGGDISRWPGSLGLAASFDPKLMLEFGRIASIEYRALGITTALSPQIDIATDPRWYRFGGTFGPSPKLSAAMARAYLDGFQTSSEQAEITDGWGFESVNGMAKHWPGGGSGEGGRDAHYGFGKFAVYPGNNFETQLIPFIEGAFDLNEGTGMASAIMPYYTISFNQDPGGENVGNAFNKYIITELLRDKYGFDGVVCTDWGVTRDDAGMAVFGQTPWGVEDLSVAERHYRILMAGCDQFGGNNDAEPVIEAYEMGVAEHGEEWMRARFERSAVRLLKNIFQTGIFENPYLDVEKTIETVGKPDFMTAGYNAQLRSVVLLKNKNSVLPLSADTKLYIPDRFIPASENFFGAEIPSRTEPPIKPEVASEYFDITDDPASADAAVVVIEQPKNGRTAGYKTDDADAGGNGFMPISLQYDTYTAAMAREQSIAGDARPGDVLNRSYRGKTVRPSNHTDLEMIRSTVEAMDPVVVREFEPIIDGLLVDFYISDQAVLDIISGKSEPSALLPMQIPANMETVETQFEDVPFDMDPHQDSEGNTYDFAFGMNWNGVISDKRVSAYRPQTE
ncbi:MAG: glycoside hydrolase family 3 N-terminal domain-containing protein [Cyclobacteriaceae bacterium]